MREIREELGCIIHPVRPMTPVLHREKDRTIRLIPFLCEPEEGRLPIPLEHESLGFFSSLSLPSLPWAPADLPILQEWLDRNAR